MSRTMSLRVRLAVIFVLVLAADQSFVLAAGWKAGVGKVNITPPKYIWMSGYGSRNTPAKSKLTDLWAKALVLEDPEGQRIVMLTVDLVGIDRQLALEVRHRLKKKHGFKLAQSAIFSSHTHTGPVVGRNLRAMYFLTDDQWDDIGQYAIELSNNLVLAVDRAMAKTRPARVEWGRGRATFAVNRRNNREPDVPKLRADGLLKGPVDHDVPVLKVTHGNQLAAIVFGYACHATVLSSFGWSGDYPGFAQIELEKRHPNAIAMFWAGCGADQNPLPRRKVELAKQYGRRLADAVDAVLKQPMRPLKGSIGTQYREIDLAFAKLPSRVQIEKDAKSSDGYKAGRAKVLLERIAQDGELSQTYPYPIQTWRLGNELIFVTLGGEVVVDFSLRLKREAGPNTTWVAGYANDVMAYIPSLRVLKEGGYEGARAMIYYGQPASWSTAVEEHIVKTVMSQIAALKGD